MPLAPDLSCRKSEKFAPVPVSSNKRAKLHRHAATRAFIFSLYEKERTHTQASIVRQMSHMWRWCPRAVCAALGCSALTAARRA